MLQSAATADHFTLKTFEPSKSSRRDKLWLWREASSCASFPHDRQIKVDHHEDQTLNLKYNFFVPPTAHSHALWLKK